MIYQAFFFSCVAAVIVASILSDHRVKALLFGCVGLGAGYLVELRGTTKNEWSYANVNSVLLVTDIPIEILFGYFAAAFFIVILITYLPRLSTQERRTTILHLLLVFIGVVLLVQAYAFGSISLVVGWAFLGIFGFSVSHDKTLPLTVGLCGFLADWVVEGVLIHQSEYYSQGWDPTIALVFMFAGMFMTGVYSHIPTTVRDISLQLGRAIRS